MEKLSSLNLLNFMSVTKNICFNPLRPLRALIQLNYLSLLIHFINPLNPLILYCTGTHFFPIVMLLRTHTFAQSGGRRRKTGDMRPTGNVRQKTWGSQEKLDRQETWGGQKLWDRIRETGDVRHETGDVRKGTGDVKKGTGGLRKGTGGLRKGTGGVRNRKGGLRKGIRGLGIDKFYPDRQS